MRNTFFMLVVLGTTLFCHVALADLYHDFVYVIPDAELAKGTLTREDVNRECPRCEKKWRDAWAAEGTKRDNKSHELIRKIASRPKDMPPTKNSTETTQLKGN